MLRWKKNSIAHRLTVQVILFSTVVTLILTVLQLYLDYRQEMKGIDVFFATIEQASLKPLAESVWILDDLQVNLQLEGLIKPEDVVYAAVYMDDRVAWEQGAPAKGSSIAHSFPLFHQSRGISEQIGRLDVVVSLEGLYQRLLRRVVTLLIGNAVKTFLVAGFILFFFRKYITQHLVELADYVADLNIQDRKPQPLRLGRGGSADPDELDQVVAALNALGQSGSQAFAELRIQEQRFRLFLDSTEDAILGVDLHGRCTFINRSGQGHFSPEEQAELIGCDILALLTRNCQGLPQPDALTRQIRTTIDRATPLQTDELPFRRGDGTVLSISARSYPLVENEQCVGALVFFADISLQQKLEQEKQLFTKVIRQSPSLILITNANGMIEYVNASFAQIMGYSGEQLSGKWALACFQELNLGEQIEQARQVIQRGETWFGTFSGVNALGRRVNVETFIFPIFDSKRQLTHVAALGRDRTRELELLEQLHHAQKMEAIGTLAASIAHEFGNPLLGIRFTLRDVRQRQGMHPDDQKLLQLAENECDRMRKLIRDLQQFSRPSTGRRTNFDLHLLLDDLIRLHHKFFAKKKIEISRQFDSRKIPMYAVEDQIRQVFTNLLINAGDAMAAGGGRLTIETLLGDEKVVVAVIDEGVGIKDDDLSRIFEPFYTTKSAVEGTGLGLPVSYGIVRAHGGSIEVQSQPGRTVFTVILPLHAPSLKKNAMEMFGVG